VRKNRFSQNKFCTWAWVDSPYNTFDKPLPPEPRGESTLIYLLSLCFGVFVDCDAKPKRQIDSGGARRRRNGTEGRKRMVRAALASGHPAIQEYWDLDRMPKNPALNKRRE
jgi:hypothetical protein